MLKSLQKMTIHRYGVQQKLKLQLVEYFTNYFKLLIYLPYDGTDQVFLRTQGRRGGTEVATNALHNLRATKPRTKGHFKAKKNQRDFTERTVS